MTAARSGLCLWADTAIEAQADAPPTREPRSRWRAFAAGCCMLLGAAALAHGLWIPAKAALAQHLLNDAWRASLADGQPHKPWPWADTEPLARLRAPAHGVDLIALAGAGGNSLAFGPGHVSHSGAPGGDDTIVIGGHRDTHFRFLQDLRNGDTLTLQDRSGAVTSYVVDATQVADARSSRLRLDAGSRTLVLVTCYPFDAPGGNASQRYVVAATARDVSL